MSIGLVSGGGAERERLLKGIPSWREPGAPSHDPGAHDLSGNQASGA